MVLYDVVGWFPTIGIIRLSQPPAGDWLAGAWAELGNILRLVTEIKNKNNRTSLKTQ